MGLTSEYEDFIAAQRQDDYPPDPEQLSALDTLFSDPAVPVSQLAEQIAGPIISALEKNPGKPVECSPLWCTISLAIKQFTEFSDKFVELVVELQKVSDPAGYIAGMDDMKMYWTEFAFNCKIFLFLLFLLFLLFSKFSSSAKSPNVDTTNYLI
jgi:hypothetical protein